MKKVLVLVAVMLSVCLGLAAVAGAVSTFVADGEAKILKTVTDGETIASRRPPSKGHPRAGATR